MMSRPSAFLALRESNASSSSSIDISFMIFRDSWSESFFFGVPRVSSLKSSSLKGCGSSVVLNLVLKKFSITLAFLEGSKMSFPPSLKTSMNAEVFFLLEMQFQKFLSLLFPLLLSNYESCISFSNKSKLHALLLELGFLPSLLLDSDLLLALSIIDGSP